jgi:hypothetical protein
MGERYAKWGGIKEKKNYSRRQKKLSIEEIIRVLKIGQDLIRLHGRDAAAKWKNGRDRSNICYWTNTSMDADWIKTPCPGFYEISCS